MIRRLLIAAFFLPRRIVRWTEFCDRRVDEALQYLIGDPR